MDKPRCQKRSPSDRYEEGHAGCTQEDGHTGYQCTQEEGHTGYHTALRETGVEYTPDRIKRVLKFDGAVDLIKRSDLTPVTDSKKGTIFSGKGTLVMGSNKYGAKKTMYRGCLYHSKKEAEFAMELDSELLKKKISAWSGQETLIIDVNGMHICDVVVDFRVVHLDGLIEYVEVKGYATDVWKLKRKLVAAVHPDIKYTVR